jgi:hypothetical protein
MLHNVLQVPTIEETQTLQLRVQRSASSLLPTPYSLPSQQKLF